MKLTTLTARNFKGLSFTLELKDINFLVGSNFAGKSARTDAIRFLLLGYLPELGKTNAATFGLASGREMVVEGTFDTGETIRRRLYLQGNSVKSEETIPPEIADAGQLAVMLNAETYFALSDRERVNYVFANVKLPETYTQEGIIGQLREHTLVDHAGPTRDNMLTSLRGIGAGNIQAFVEEALGWLTTEAKGAKDHVTKMEKTVQGLTAMRVADTPTTSLEQLDRDRQSLVTEIEAQQGIKAHNQAAYDTMMSARQRREAIEVQLRSLPGLRQSLESLKQRHAQRTDALTAIPVVTQAQIDDLREKEHTLRSRGARLVEDLRANARTGVNLKEELSTLTAKTTCPYCGATGEGWKTLKESEINSTLSGLEEKQCNLLAEQEKNQSEHGGLAATIQRANEHLQQRNTIDREIAALQQDWNKTELAIDRLTNLQGELERMPANDPNIMAAVDTAQCALGVAKDRLAEVDRIRKTVMARAGEVQRLAQAEKERDEAKADLATFVAAGKRLREIQGEMVTAAFTPLLATANSFFGPILRSPIAYHDGEIGTFRNGVWVSHRTFSGTEKALTYAAIQAALASTCPVRIMLIDELGRLDADNAMKLLGAIERSIAAGIDQFVGIDATNRYKNAFAHPDDSQIVTI